MKYAVETTSKSKIGIDIMALKLSKKSYFTKQPTPVTDMKSKLNGDVKRQKLRKLFEKADICINLIGFIYTNTEIIRIRIYVHQ